MNTTVTISVLVNAPLEQVWKSWSEPEHIVKWAHASDDWECPKASNDLRVGGRFSSLFAAKDKSESFDFAGVYTAVTPHAYIAYTMDDGRTVETAFEQTAEGIQVTQTFEIEQQNPEDMQRSGWQAILNNFKAHTESLVK